MMRHNTVRVYISDVYEPYCYESLKGIIDDCLEGNFAGKEIVIFCSEKDVDISIGERYAVENGIEVEHLSEYCSDSFMLSETARIHTIAKLSDFMILFRGQDLSDIVTLFEYAVKCGTPLQMIDVA